MKQLLNILFVTCAAVCITGCASGPKFGQTSLRPLAPGNGRVYFYRTAVAGAAVQPMVRLNGQEVGKAKPKGFFFVDRPPGNYEAETSTEVKRRLSFTLNDGQIRYVRLNISMGFFVGHVYPELVETKDGEKEITKCSYMEADPKKDAAAAP